MMNSFKTDLVYRGDEYDTYKDLPQNEKGKQCNPAHLDFIAKTKNIDHIEKIIARLSAERTEPAKSVYRAAKQRLKEMKKVKEQNTNLPQ